MTSITEIAPDTFRITTFIAEINLGFTQFLVRDDEPLLYHTGGRALFPVVHEAVSKLIDPATLRWIGFSHFEADECGSLNEWHAAGSPLPSRTRNNVSFATATIGALFGPVRPDADPWAARQRQLDRIVCASSARAASISHARRICRGDRDETAARTSLAVLASISGHSSRRSAISFGMLARSKSSASGSR